MSQAILDEITKLTDVWYRLIGRDHHKDRDCHFYIECRWSYGNEERYFPQHYGYIRDDINDVPKDGFPTFNHAAIHLRDKLQEMIDEEKRSN